MQKDDYQQLARDFTLHAEREARRSFGDGNIRLLFNRNGESCILVDIKNVATQACKTANSELPIVMQMAANPVQEGAKTLKLRRLEEMKALDNSGTYKTPSAKLLPPVKERSPDEMEIDFGLCPAFTEEMFYSALQMLRDTSLVRQNTLKIDTMNSTGIDRQIKISGFDPQRLPEQARLLVQAIKGGIVFAQAKPNIPRVIDTDPRYTLNNSRIFLDYNFTIMGL